MRTRYGSFTLIELVALIAISIVLAILFVLLFRHALEESRRKACTRNLDQISQAMIGYTQVLQQGFYPFSWMPAFESSPRRKDAMTSLGELYAVYCFPGIMAFRCPARDDRPSVRLNAPVGRNGRPPTEYEWSNRNYTVVGSSYGYDCRMYPSAVNNHVLVGELDGAADSALNHPGGRNLLYFDGHVSMATSNYASNDPLDNIYCEDPWNADTDCFLSNNTAPGNRRGPADQFNDLTVSYDGYEQLHPEE